MKRLLRRLLVCGVLGAFTGAAVSATSAGAVASAGAAASGAGTTAEWRDSVLLGEVVVQSFKEEKRLKEVPASLTVLRAGDVKKRALLSIKELSSSIPNVFFPEYGSKLTSPFYIRGIGSKLTPSVGVYVDGIPYFEKSTFEVDLADVSRIELLRGPQGTLYGRNTMGGILNVYTRNPLDRPGMNAELLTGTYGQRQLSGSVYGRVYEGASRVGYGLSLRYRHQDGFFTNAFLGEQADPMDEWAARGKLQWKTDGDWNGLLSIQYAWTEQGGYPYGKLDTLTHRVEEVSYNAYSSYRQQVVTGGLSLEKAFDRYAFKSLSSYQYLDDHQAIDQDFTEADRAFVQQMQQQHQASQSLELRSRGRGIYAWVTGLFGFVQAGNREVLFVTDKLYEEPTLGWAAFHQSTISSLGVEGLSMSVGLRYDYERAAQVYEVWSLNEDGTERLNQTSRLEDHRVFQQFTPKASVQYRLNPDHMMYASATRGYKTGGFNVTFSTEEERTYEPEYSWNYELGGRFAGLNQRLTGEWALFYIDWRNQQITHTVANTVGTLLTNSGHSYSKGVELSLQANPLNDWNVQASFGYTEAKFRTYWYGTTDYAGKYIPYIPRTTWMLGSDYAFRPAVGWVDRVLISMNYTGTGRLYWREDNRVRQQAYALLNGKLSVMRNEWTLSAWVKNALETEYVAYLFQTSGTYFAQRGKPRTFGVSFAYTL